MSPPKSLPAPKAGDNYLKRPIRFTVEDANNCGWCFNCGPGALAAILNLTPAELRPLMGDFERKGYANPTLMWDILNRSGAIWRKVYRSDEPGKPLPPLTHGLIRIQWSGPWTRPGVPTAARYRQTHWIAARARSEEIFDVNATCSGGWIARHEWESALVPWLLRACCPKADGGWWPTHAVEVTPNK